MEASAGGTEDAACHHAAQPPSEAQDLATIGQHGLKEPSDADLADRQRKVAAAALEAILDKMLDVRAELATTSDPKQCEGLLALLRDCTSTYKLIQKDLLQQ